MELDARSLGCRSFAFLASGIWHLASGISRPITSRKVNHQSVFFPIVHPSSFTSVCLSTSSIGSCCCRSCIDRGMAPFPFSLAFSHSHLLVFSSSHHLIIPSSSFSALVSDTLDFTVCIEKGPTLVLQCDIWAHETKQGTILKAVPIYQVRPGSRGKTSLWQSP